MSGPIRFSAHGVSGEMQPLGAMLGPVSFTLANGRNVRPFAVAPWADDPRALDLPPILQRLRGEWPCVPFGMPTAPAGLPFDWRMGDGAATVDPDPHGYASNHTWDIEKNGPGAVAASIAYPPDHPVDRLDRRVTVAGEGRLAIDLVVTVRRDCRLPVGLHPTFRLPDLPGDAQLDVPRDSRAWTFPVDPEPGRAAFAPDQRTRPIDVLLSSVGTIADPRTLPFADPSEDLVLLTGTGGRAGLVNRNEGYQIDLAWDVTVLPSLLLWISNGGRRDYPWNGSFRALGMEPVAAPFDLGTAIATANNPLAAAGVATSVAFSANAPRRIALEISCRQIA